MSVLVAMALRKFYIHYLYEIIIVQKTLESSVFIISFLYTQYIACKSRLHTVNIQFSSLTKFSFA